MARTWIDSVKTGDLLFFNGRNFISRVIEWSGHSPWSHVGMIVRFPPSISGGALAGRVCLWESVNNAVRTRALSVAELVPAMPGRGAVPIARYEPDSDRTGVRLVDLNERLDAIGDHEQIGLARLTMLSGGGSGATQQQQEALLQRSVNTSIVKYNGRPYEFSSLTLMLSWLDCCDRTGACCSSFNAEDLRAFFCSELVAQTLHDAQLVQWTRPELGLGSAGEVTVADLARLSDPANQLHWPGRQRLTYAPVRLVNY